MKKYKKVNLGKEKKSRLKMIKVILQAQSINKIQIYIKILLIIIKTRRVMQLEKKM
jgi:hypothetical protein